LHSQPRRPEPSYEGNYNFFDPDCYLTVTALVFSGNEYLQRQVRDMLEKTVEFVRDDGLMPHHLTVDQGVCGSLLASSLQCLW
jgi:hypothetical protein